MDSCETLQFYAGAGAKDYVLPGDGGNAVQEPIKIFKGAIQIFVVVLVVVKQNRIDRNVFSDQGQHCRTSL